MKEYTITQEVLDQVVLLKAEVDNGDITPHEAFEELMVLFDMDAETASYIIGEKIGFN